MIPVSQTWLRNFREEIAARQIAEADRAEFCRGTRPDRRRSGSLAGAHASHGNTTQSLHVPSLGEHCERSVAIAARSGDGSPASLLAMTLGTRETTGPDGFLNHTLRPHSAGYRATATMWNMWRKSCHGSPQQRFEIAVGVRPDVPEDVGLGVVDLNLRPLLPKRVDQAPRLPNGYQRVANVVHDPHRRVRPLHCCTWCDGAMESTSARKSSVSWAYRHRASSM